jgi:hypothetical protein
MSGSELVYETERDFEKYLFLKAKTLSLVIMLLLLLLPLLLLREVEVKKERCCNDHPHR